MSLGDAPAKFPDLPEDDSIRPSATRENPGQVYPKVDPSPPRRGSSGSNIERELSPNRYHGDPHHLQSGLKRLNNALDDVITIIEQDSATLGPHTGNENGLLLKFRGWRQELGVHTGAGDRVGHGFDMGDGVPAELGGIFTD